MSQIPIRISKDKNTYDLHVMWSIHNKCNYSCSYCPESLHNGEWQWLKLDRLKSFIDKIENHYVHILGFKKILFSFTGGEPTLWKDFKPFVKYIHGKGFRCGLTTNASVSPNFWNDIAHIFDYIAFSFHPEKADSEKFLATYKSLHDNPNSVNPSVRVMMHKDDIFWKKSERLIQDLKKFDNWTYECVHILDEYGTDSTKIDYESSDKEKFLEDNAFCEQFNNNDILKEPQTGFHYSYTTEDNKVQKLNENELINNDLVNFESWNCFIGIESLFIHFSGDVKTAGCGAGQTLGNILFFEKIRFPTRPIVCNQKSCLCPTDVRITKSKPKLDLDYELSDSQGSMVTVGSNTSVFTSRLFINLSPKVLVERNISIEDYIKNINIFIDKLSQTESLCTYIEVDPDFNIDSIDGFYKKLSLIKGFKVLLTNNFGDNEDNFNVIAKEFNLIVSRIDSFQLLVKVQGLLSSIQDQIDNKLFLEISIEQDKEIFSFKVLEKIKKLKYFEFNLYDNSHPFIQKLISQNGGNHFAGFKVQDETLTRSTLKHKFAFDEVVIMDNQRLSTLRTESNEYRFAGWQCSIGQNHFRIEDNLSIASSDCPHSQVLGTIMDPANFQIRTSPIVCAQEFCKNHFEQAVAKRVPAN